MAQAGAANAGEGTAGKSAALAWEAFCDSLKEAGRQLLRTDFPMNELDLAEGLRYLARLAYTSVDRNLEGADPAHPLLYPLCSERIKVGGDNPDNRYYAAAISDQYDYVLRGDFRSCTYFSVVATGKVDGSEAVISGSIRGEDVVPEGNGTSEIWVSNHRQGPNCVRTDERSSLLIVRCTLERSTAEHVPPTFVRSGSPEAPSPLVLADTALKLSQTARFVVQASSFFADFTARFQAHVNTLPIYPDQKFLVSIGGDPNITYYLSAWALEADEVLTIHLSDWSPCRTWNLQLCNVWFESLDYSASQIHVNGTTAVYDPEGTVSIRVSERNPGGPNWLRTLGHRSGLICMRLVGAERPVTVLTRVEKVAQPH